jgi:hypothetical protein
MDGELRWTWSLPVGSLVLTLPRQQLDAAELDDIDAVVNLALKTIRRMLAAPPSDAAPDDGHAPAKE